MKITEENLVQNGWAFDDVLYQKMKNEPFAELFREWGKDFNIDGKTYYCKIDKTSNMNDRDWYVRIDNGRFEPIGGLDVDTYEQIDKLLELLKDEN